MHRIMKNMIPSKYTVFWWYFWKSAKKSAALFKSFFGLFLVIRMVSYFQESHASQWFNKKKHKFHPGCWVWSMPWLVSTILNLLHKHHDEKVKPDTSCSYTSRYMGMQPTNAKGKIIFCWLIPILILTSRCCLLCVAPLYLDLAKKPRPSLSC